jgi:hypothetical protein
MRTIGNLLFRIFALLFGTYELAVLQVDYANTILLVAALIGGVAGWLMGSLILAALGAVVAPILVLLAFAAWVLQPIDAS